MVLGEFLEGGFGVFVALAGSLAIPSDGFGNVLLQAFPYLVAVGEVELGQRMPLVGCGAVEIDGFLVVGRDPFTLLIQGS